MSPPTGAERREGPDSRGPTCTGRDLPSRSADRRERTRRGVPSGRVRAAWVRPRAERLEYRSRSSFLIGGPLALLLRAAALLPLRAAHAVGAALGRLLGALPTEQRRVAALNLRLAFPESTPRERARLLARSSAELGRTVAELPAVWGWSRERIEGLVRSVEGLEHLEAARARGRGVLFLAPHVASWELLLCWTSIRLPVTVLYRAPRYAAIEALSRRGRERFGAELVPSSSQAVRSMLRTLAANGLVGIAPDQDSGEGSGVFVPFFGELANTGVILPRLAARTGASVVLAWSERLPRARGFRLHFTPAREEVASADLERAARALNQEVEDLVRRLPEQYLWSYKRYRIRPPGSLDPYRPHG